MIRCFARAWLLCWLAGTANGEPAAAGEALPALNSESPAAVAPPPRLPPQSQPGPRGAAGRDGVAGVSYITASETVSLPTGGTRSVFAHCPSGSLVSGCSAHSSHPYGIPYRFYPVDKDSCEATFFNIGTAERVFEFQAIAHCILTHGNAGR